MKTHKLLKTVLFLLVALFFASCEKYVTDESSITGEANSTLVVRTRAVTVSGAGSAAKVSYPVTVYVFDSNSRCIEMMTIESGSDQGSLVLPEGVYDVYAIAGAETSSYELPTKETATKESVVALKAGSSHGDLMVAHNNVVLSYGEENTLTLSLERKVMMLESITVNNIPESVKDVSVSISPLHENILLNGEYSGDGYVYTAKLTDAGAGVWKYDAGVYLLEASGAATVKVSLTDANGTAHSYSYQCPEELKANYKININGTYSGGGIDLVGTITGVEWAGSTDITFTFDENGSVETVDPDTSGDDNEGGSAISGKAPGIGTLYKGCFVIRSEQSGGYTKVTLMSTDRVDKVAWDDGSGDDGMKDAIDEAISSLSADGIMGWRLPTLEEMTYLHEHWSSDLDKAYTEVTTVPGSSGQNYFKKNCNYYCTTPEGDILCYNLYNGNEDKSPVSGGSNYAVIAIATLNFAGE